MEDLQSLISTYSKSRGLARLTLTFLFGLETFGLETLDSIARSGDEDPDADAGLREETFRFSTVEET